MAQLNENSQYDLNRLRNLIAQAQVKLQPHLSKYDLNKITYLVSYSLTEVGLYTHENGKDTIKISAALSAESDEEVFNTIYHEFAHFVVHSLLHSAGDDEALIYDSRIPANDDRNLQKLLPGLVLVPTFIVADGVNVVLPAAATKIVIKKSEIESADQSSAHGEFWKYIAGLFDKKFGCSISQFYENNNLIGAGVNYKEECPKCGWSQIINQQNRPTEFNTLKNFEQNTKDEGHQLLCTKCKNPIKVTNLSTNKLITESLLTEATRVQLASTSRNAGAYKDQSMGKNRFERKKYCKIAASVKQYNNIDMNQLFKQDRLEVQIPVIGETDTYNVTIRIDGVIAEIARNIKVNKYRLEFRTIIQSLTKVFNTADVYVNCTCPDHLYNFAHWNIVHNCSTADSAHDPGPGKGTANPHDDKGRGCKHTLLVLANGDWMMKVASVINNYLHYMSEKMQKPFLKLIFPKLYGCEAEEMAKLDILGEDEVEDTLETSSSFIDAINEYGKNRGKFKKGSNKNTAAKTVDKPEEQPEDEQNNIKQQEDPNKSNLAKAEKESDAADKKAAEESEQNDKENDKQPEPETDETEEKTEESENNV